jgi:hypothetical protein
MSVKISTAAGLISALPITGLTILDLDEIRELMSPRDLPCMMPHPRNFFSNFATIPQNSTNNYANETYTLHYRLYFKAITGSIKFFGPYADMIKMTEKILNKFISSDSLSGAIYVKPRIEFLGGVEDHAGNIYHGGDIAFDIMDLYEVA